MSKGKGIKYMKKVAFYTLGCKVNQYETDSMKAIFENGGYGIVDFDGYADVYVINTCTVTAMGDKKSRQIIHLAKNNNKDGVVIVTGCMAQGIIRDNKTIDGADIIVGNEDRKNILNILNEYCGEKIVNVSDIKNEREFWESHGVISEDRTRAYIKIQDGCDRYCSYCIIPYVRGPIRSRDFNEVINEAENMVKDGFSEIVLIGIHLASYGRDNNGKNLMDVLEELSKIDGIRRIRLGSLEPSFISKENIDRMRRLDKVCKHFHLSLQSGCDTILKRMNRKYTTSEYEEKVYMIREAFPDAAITTDVIVGFPGENEEEFNETYEYLKRINLSKMHIFPYSRRTGTPAAKMPNQVEKSVKKERADKLIKLSHNNEIAFAKRFLDRKIEVILENRLKEGYREGYSEQYVPVLYKGGNAKDVIIGVGKKVTDNGEIVIE